MKMKKLFSLFAVGLVFGIVMIGFSLSNVDSKAVGATAVTLTDTEGTQTVLVAATETATYSWNPETVTLTLNEYSGRTITTNGDINLHLKGENTLTMDASQESGQLYGINLDYHSVTVSADDGGELNIIGNNLQTYFSAVAGGVLMKNGTINIDVDTSSGGYLYAFERGVTFESESSENAEINVSIERTGSSNSFIYAFYNGVYMTNRENVEINVDLKGSENDTLYGFSDISIHESSPRIIVNLDNNGGYANHRKATNGMQSFSLTEGGYVELNGTVRRGDMGGSANVHTVTTTPADNNYVWIENDNNAYYSGDFYLCTLDGDICYKTVFEYTDTPATLKWVGGEHFNIPAGQIDDPVSLNILAGIRGVSTYDNYYWNLEIVEGQLPEGIFRAYSGGLINGNFTSVCEAGSVTIKAVDKNMTLYDTNDDREILITIGYGEVVDKDRFLLIGDSEPLEMKSNGNGEGWNYNADTKTLTLDGYDNGPISTEGLLNIHLVGENTITLTNANTIGIESTYISGDVHISADDGGTLNLNTPIGYTKSYTGIKANLYLHSGELSIDLASDFTGDSYFTGIALHGYLGFDSEDTEAVVYNVKLKNNAVGENVRLHGNYNNSVYLYNRDNVQINIDIKGDEYTSIEAIRSLTVYNSAVAITVVADNNGGSADCFAVKGLNGMHLADGGVARFTGKIFTNYLPSGQSPNTVTTTPLDNNYFWKDTNPHYYYEDFWMCDLNGDVLNYVVFEHTDTPAPLKWVGENHLYIPGGSVGDNVAINLWQAIRGSNDFTIHSSYWNFEVIEGQLPVGLYINSYNGKSDGKVTKPCVAGTVRIRATDLAGTNDTTDDRSVEFEISYGAFITDTPVSGIAIDQDSIILNNIGSGQISVTVTPSNAAYPNVIVAPSDNPFSVSIGDPVDAVSIITLTSQGTSGKYTLTVKTVELGLADEVTVYVREATPNITINYIKERISGLVVGGKYKISGEDVDDLEFIAENDYYNIPESWIGKTINIVRVHESEENCNSLSQELLIPDRPDAPMGVGKTDASASDASDGSIIDIDDTMEYQLLGGTWKIINGDSVSNLAVGTYNVRYQGTDIAFASKTTPIIIGYGELAFVDNDSYDVPSGDTNTEIVFIDVKNAVSGGKKPYTYSIEGPTWLSISDDGIISGTRPAEATATTTATVSVTDGDSTTLSITVNVGAVTIPHVHNYGNVWKSDETNHWKECACGDKTLLESHTPVNDDGDCTTAITCSVCTKITTEAEVSHIPNDDDGDCTTAVTCKRCTTITTVPKANHVPNDDDGDCTTAIICKNCTTATTPANAEHTPNNDDGDCTTAVTCKNCDVIITLAKTHDFTGSWQTNDDQHWHICKNNGCEITDSKVDHISSGPATEDVAEICTVCEYVIASALGHVHNYNAQEYDNENHWMECECGEKDNISPHTPEDDDGDCTTALACSECDKVITEAKANHTGGTATCESKAVCSVCSKEYGQLAAHTPEDDDGDCTTDRLCSVCGEVAIEGEANHTGGTATCEEKAKCEICNNSYGALIEHNDTDSNGKCDRCNYQMNVPNPTPGPNPIPTPDPEPNTDPEYVPEESNDGLSGGAITGIVVASTAVAGAGGFSIFWFAVQRKTFAELGIATKGVVANVGTASKTLAKKIATASKKVWSKIVNVFKK